MPIPVTSQPARPSPRRYRAGYFQLAQVIVRGSLSNWKKYLDLAYPVKPVDWTTELARIEAKPGEPGRMKVLQAMFKANPGDADAQLANVTCPVLVIERSLDPDGADPRAEGEKIIADLPAGLGELAVIDGAGSPGAASWLVLMTRFSSRNPSCAAR